jgi:hypothetical protein
MGETGYERPDDPPGGLVQVETKAVPDDAAER